MYEVSWMIHHPTEAWKLARMNFSGLSWKPHLVDSVDLQTDAGRQVLRDLEAYLAPSIKTTLAGNLGAALAHIRLWKRLIDGTDTKAALIFEDNVLFHSNSLSRVNASLAMLPNAEFVNFAVLRPKGSVLYAKEGIPRYVVNPRMHEPISNVWQSSYYISRTGAQRLLGYLAPHRLQPQDHRSRRFRF